MGGRQQLSLLPHTASHSIHRVNTVLSATDLYFINNKKYKTNNKIVTALNQSALIYLNNTILISLKELYTFTTLNSNMSILPFQAT